MQVQSMSTQMVFPPAQSGRQLSHILLTTVEQQGRKQVATPCHGGPSSKPPSSNY